MTRTHAAVVGSNVRAEMARKNISQTTLAQALDLSQAQVSKRLRGEIAFNVNELHAAAEFLGINAAVLLDHTVGTAA